MSTSSLWIESLASAEGYRRMPDIGREGALVVGYGVRLDQGLTQEEAQALFNARCRTVWSDLLTIEDSLVLDCLPAIQGVLFQLGFSLSVKVLSKRKILWTRIRKREFHLIASEILRMSIGKSQPARASNLANRCRSAISRTRNSWRVLRSRLIQKGVDLDRQPHAIQIALAQVVEGVGVDTLLEYRRIWRAIRAKDHIWTAKEIVEVPYIQLPELTSIPKDIPLNRIRANLNKPDTKYIRWLNSHSSELPSQHLIHGRAAPVY